MLQVNVESAQLKRKAHS